MRGKRFALNLFLCRKGRVIKKVLGQTAAGSRRERWVKVSKFLFKENRQ